MLSPSCLEDNTFWEEKASEKTDDERHKTYSNLMLQKIIMCLCY